MNRCYRCSFCCREEIHENIDMGFEKNQNFEIMYAAKGATNKARI
jgi:hypothetical protein